MTQSPARIDGSSILITGGCGFIGSHLVTRLAERGARRIVVVDSLRYGDRANLGNVASGIEIVRHTLGTDDASALQPHLRGIDYVFHFAAEKHNQSKDDPRAVLRSNVDGTYTLFDLAARSGVRKIVFASSLYAYGRMQGLPFREDEVPQPQTVYGISKLCGEHFLRHTQAVHGVAYGVLRYLFVYGPRQFAGTGYKSVIVKNFERMLAEQPPIVYGDGLQELDYVFIDDAVDAAIRALESTVRDGLFNIGSGAGISVNALTDLMLETAQRQLPKQHEPPDFTAGSRRVGDITQARTVLGWTPRTPLRDGLAHTYDWLATRASGVVAPT